MGFAAICNKVRALLIYVKGNTEFTCTRRLSNATDLDGFVIVLVNGKKSNKIAACVWAESTRVNHLRLFGEAGTVKVVTRTSPKLADKGAQYMMVGYVENHIICKILSIDRST